MDGNFSNRDLRAASSAEGGGSPIIGGVLRFYRVSILIVAALMMSGAWSLLTLPRSEDPEFAVFDCRILTTFPGADPETMESLVTRPIEDAVAEVDAVDLVESTSISGVSYFTIRLRDDSDPEEVVADIKQRVEEIGPDLPEGANDPVVMGFSTADIPVVVLSVSGTDDLSRLRISAEAMRQKLRRVRGVSTVEIEGLPERRILVDIDNERLSQLNLPLVRVADLLKLENAAIPGGTLDVGLLRYVLQNPNEFRSLEEIGDTVIGRAGDSVVHLRDVARIFEGTEDARYQVRTNQRPAALLTIVKRGGTNTVEVARRVRDAVEKLRPRLDPDLEIHTVNDRGATVADLLGNLGWNALGGGIIVILVVSLFLGIRQGLVVSVSIPLSVLIALTLMRLTGVGLTQVSIFGLVLALGMLVDSALVVVENIGRHLESGKALRAAVIRGVDEVKMPVVASTLTTIAAFVPMLLLEGNLGSFMSGMPLAVIYALSGALVVAMTIIPLLCFTLWRLSPPAPSDGHRDSRFLDFYTEIAKAALRHRWLTLAAAGAMFLLSLSTLPLVGLQLFPKADKPFFLVNIRLPGESNLESTSSVTSQVEALLTAEPRVKTITANLGKGGPPVYYNVEREREKTNFAQILVNLDEGSAEDFVPGLTPKLHQIAGASVEAKIFEQGPVGGAPIEVRIAGPDLQTLSDLAARVQQTIGDVAGLVDLHDSLGDRTPRLVLNLDRDKAGLYGIDSFTFSRTILMSLDGETATGYRGADEEIPVVVRLDPRSITESSFLDRISIPTNDGSVVAFGEIATYEEREGFSEITRRDGRRTVTVEADVSGRLPEDALSDIQGRLADFPLPPGYEISYGGEREERIRSFAGLWEALLLALLLIYGLLAVQFNSFVQPLVILFTVPLGLTGALFGLLVSGSPFGLTAFIGIVSLTGIIINDSIVLTEFANYLQRVEGMGRIEALLEAGRTRFRPVVVTSITTIGGLGPLAIWGGTLWSPLAWAVIFGLLGATVLILVVLPVLYLVLVRASEGRRALNLWTVIGRRLFGDDQQY